jgi:hypothetical protein
MIDEAAKTRNKGTRRREEREKKGAYTNINNYSEF